MTQDWSCTILSSNFKPLGGKVYLMLMHVNLQPAHLVLLFNGSFYSVSTKQVDIGRSFDYLKSVLIKKSIPCLFIQLESPEYQIDVSHVLHLVFRQFRPLNSNGETCLTPVIAGLEKLYNCKLNANLVFDLLSFFEDRQMINKIESVNIPAGKFILKSYTVEDVSAQIRKLLIG